MQFKFVTEYTTRAMTQMARAVRKTVRKKHSRRTHIFGWMLTVLCVLLVIPTGEETFTLDTRTVVTAAAAGALVLTLIFEDRLNGYIAKKRLPTGCTKSTAVFSEDGYASETELGRTEWKYKNIKYIAESRNYFVFVFDNSHAQVYDKNNMDGGSAEEFSAFISEKTGCGVINLK